MPDDNLLIPPVVKRWSQPKEFDAKKLVSFQNFEKLTVEQVTRLEGSPPKFVPKGTPEAPVDGQDGLIRRITFLDLENPYFDAAVPRTLDMNTPRIESDLGRYGIHGGDVGYLSRHPVEGKKSFKWVWEPVSKQAALDL